MLFDKNQNKINKLSVIDIQSFNLDSNGFSTVESLCPCLLTPNKASEIIIKNFKICQNCNKPIINKQNSKQNKKKNKNEINNSEINNSEINNNESIIQNNKINNLDIKKTTIIPLAENQKNKIKEQEKELKQNLNNIKLNNIKNDNNIENTNSKESNNENIIKKLEDNEIKNINTNKNQILDTNNNLKNKNIVSENKQEEKVVNEDNIKNINNKQVIDNTKESTSKNKLNNQNLNKNIISNKKIHNEDKPVTQINNIKQLEYQIPYYILRNKNNKIKIPLEIRSEDNMVSFARRVITKLKSNPELSKKLNLQDTVLMKKLSLELRKLYTQHNPNKIKAVNL